MKKFCFLVVMIFLLPTYATGAPNPFVAVFIDAKTEKTLGPFPYDRLITAQETMC